MKKLILASLLTIISLNAQASENIECNYEMPSNMIVETFERCNLEAFGELGHKAVEAELLKFKTHMIECSKGEESEADCAANYIN